MICSLEVAGWRKPRRILTPFLDPERMNNSLLRKFQENQYPKRTYLQHCKEIKKDVVKNKSSGCKICILEDAFRGHSAKRSGAEKIEKHLNKRKVSEMCGQCSV